MASIAAGLQRSGGSIQHPATMLDARLEELAAAVESAAGPRSIAIDFQCMSELVDEVLPLLSEVVRCGVECITEVVDESEFADESEVV